MVATTVSNNVPSQAATTGIEATTGLEGLGEHSVDQPAISSVAKRTLSVREVWGLIPRAVKSSVSPTTRHRCDDSSELCCAGAKPRRWAPQLITRFGVIRQA